MSQADPVVHSIRISARILVGAVAYANQCLRLRRLTIQSSLYSTRSHTILTIAVKRENSLTSPKNGQSLCLWEEYHVWLPNRPLPQMFHRRVVADATLYSSSFSPFAARTQQYVKEQLGQAEDKVCNVILGVHWTQDAYKMFVIDAAASRLHRVGEASRYLEGCSSEDVASH